MAFDGLRILSLESRRATEMEALIRNQKGLPFVAPSMREVPIESNAEAFEFADRLFRGEFDMVILLTGVGTRYLDKVLSTRYEPQRFTEALRGVTVIVRGPKPLAVCREWNIPVAAVAPEPNTWREVLAVTEDRPERRIAVQEYGKPNPELLAMLRSRGAEVTAVPVYQWDMPEDRGPLLQAVDGLAAGRFDASLFTTSIQVKHLLETAKSEGKAEAVRQGLESGLIASIGPTTTEALEEHGFTPDFEPSHPKMGIFVVELAREIHPLLHKKRQSRL